jgi:hypothetical protein
MDSSKIIQSSKIENLLLSIPKLSAGLDDFISFSKEEKNEILAPIDLQLKQLSLTTDEVIEVLDTYSRNFAVKNIDNECEKIIVWLREEDRQAADGSWPLAGNPLDNLEIDLRKNAWASAVCSISLLKYRLYKRIFDKSYDDMISRSIEWLFNSGNIYIKNEGWKNKLSEPGINFYDTCIAIEAVLKYKQANNLNNYFTYKLNDEEIENIIQNIMGLSIEQDIGLSSYIVMTLIHYLVINDDFITEQKRTLINEQIFSGTRWLISKYEDNVGWRDNNNFPSLRISCYAIQALNKFNNNFLSRLDWKKDDPLRRIWGDTTTIIASEIARIQLCFTYKSGSWGWTDQCDNGNANASAGMNLLSTTLATSTLLKCCIKSKIVIDLSIILRAVNNLIKSFDFEVITLDNTYILCTIIDYLRFRLEKKFIQI